MQRQKVRDTGLMVDKRKANLYKDSIRISVMASFGLFIKNSCIRVW